MCILWSCKIIRMQKLVRSPYSFRQCIIKGLYPVRVQNVKGVKKIYIYPMNIKEGATFDKLAQKTHLYYRPEDFAFIIARQTPSGHKLYNGYIFVSYIFINCCTHFKCECTEFQDVENYYERKLATLKMKRK